MISSVVSGIAINRLFNFDKTIVLRTAILPKGVSFLLDHILSSFSICSILSLLLILPMCLNYTKILFLIYQS